MRLPSATLITTIIRRELLFRVEELGGEEGISVATVSGIMTPS